MVSAVLLASTWFLIILEIILRSFFDSSTQIAEEYAGYLLAAIVLVSAGQSQ